MAVLDLWEFERLRGVVGRFFPVEEAWIEDGRPLYAVRPIQDAGRVFAALRQAVASLGYLPVLRRRDERLVVSLVPAPPMAARHWILHLALFLATVATTFLAGYQMAEPLVAEGRLGSAAGGGLAFSLSLLAILGTHEMGHKIASMRRGIDASLPYFIPVPPIPGLLSIGTLGAVIVTRTPAPNRDALVDLGASGPIAGFLVAIPVLILGIARSFVLPTIPPNTINLPDPLLVRWLVGVLLHPPAGAVVLVHPMAMAGWIGLLVTSINLLPSGMLDGGHVVRAAFGPRWHAYVSVAAIVLAAALGYLLMAVLMLLMLRRGHPGPLDDITPVGRRRLLVAASLVVIFAVSATPLYL